jgi:D-alanyl-lipoteichoic acid acyltransferase DltB (MBOAT superfamily)
VLFNSYGFIFLFLPFSFLGYFFLNTRGYVLAPKIFLVAVSLFFYSWWNIFYLPILIASILFNYEVGKWLHNQTTGQGVRQRYYFLLFGISLNLGLLGYFKYYDFFIENVNGILQTDMGLLNLALPLGISFFTFQQITFLVDSYKNRVKTYAFWDYALFVSFFPQLIAGPIVHHAEMMPQFEAATNRCKDYRHIAAGLFIFSIGLFKKVVIADTFAVWVTNGFDMAKKLNMIEAWVTSLSYTFQLYFDFSGYTDMAIGIALLFNIKLPINFNSPYKAVSIRDFWRRWHMTLSRFLKDYVYIPLGGNRLGRYRTYLNIWVTFLLAGVWHGAGWTFVLWGVLHGGAMVVHRLWQKTGLRMNRWIAWFMTFNFINLSWVVFRAKEFDDALKVFKGMFFGDIVLFERLFAPLGFLREYGIHFGPVLYAVWGDNWTFIWIIAAFGIVLFAKNSIQMTEAFHFNVRTLLFSAALFSVAVLFLGRVSEFLYFDF